MASSEKGAAGYLPFSSKGYSNIIILYHSTGKPSIALMTLLVLSIVFPTQHYTQHINGQTIDIVLQKFYYLR